MKIEKYLTTPIEARFDGLTLMSTGEYFQFKENIPTVMFGWWLRSPGSIQYYAALVTSDGSRDYYAVNSTLAVRPALIVNQESTNLQIGDRFKFFGHNWTVISDKYALCDEAFCRMAFRKDWRANDANMYEASDINRYLYDELEKMEESEQDVY